MECKVCRSSFEKLDALGSENKRVQEIDRLHPNCECQNVSVSMFSPGPVRDDEILIRFVIAPFNGKDKPKTVCLQNAEVGGLSVYRKGIVSDEELRTYAETLVFTAKAARGIDPHSAGLMGVLEIRADVIRNCTTSDEVAPGFCVYDTAEVDNRSHAEAIQRMHNITPGLNTRRRAALFKLVHTGFIPVADFRRGLLADLAPKSPDH